MVAAHVFENNFAVGRWMNIGFHWIYYFLRGANIT